MPLSENLHWIGANLLAILVIRTLPFAVYAACAQRVRPPAKAFTAAAWLTLAALLVSLGPGFRAQLVEIIQGAAYFIAACITCHGIRRLGQRDVLGKWSVLVLCAILFQLVPALLLRGPGSATVHVIGWELMLGAYSYCVDRDSTSSEPTLRECLFFLLVNPVLVFNSRGVDLKRVTLDRRALMYCTIGLLAIAGQASLHVVNEHPMLTARGDLLGITGARTYLLWIGYCTLQFFAAYWGMAGVANLQSGLMRVAGFQVADRFRYPFLARTPTEFWERWNWYVTEWFRRYVFAELALSRRLPRASAVRWIVATLGTFTAIGLAHEYALLLSKREAHGAATFAFVTASLVVSGWMVASRSLRSVFADLAARSRWTAIALNTASRALFLHVAVILAWLMIPALSGAGFPQSVAHVFGQEPPFSTARAE